MKRLVTVTIAILLTLTLTGSVAVVVSDAPKYKSVRWIELKGCRLDDKDSSDRPAILTLLDRFC